MLSYRLRQHKAYRTRIQFPSLIGNSAWCNLVQDRLAKLTGVKVEVRLWTGSVILEHHEGEVDICDVIDTVQQVCSDSVDIETNAALQGVGTIVTKKENRKYHVSGGTLIVSGLYLVYLSLRRITIAAGAVVGVATATGTASIATLPVIATFTISLPVQRQAIDNFRRTGRPDMGMISTGILYYSLLTGNILASYTVFWLFNLSGWLESRIKTKTRKNIRNLLSSEEKKVWLQTDEGEIEVDAKDVVAGDRLVFRYGEKIPVDGEVIRGEGFTDESMMTGESSLVFKGSGDHVLSGTMVADGEILVRVTKTGEETRLATIIKLIENAENDPGELQITSQKFSQMMVPISLSIAATTFLLTGNLLQAMAVLIITCPCAIRLSTSVAISSAMTRASAEGILIKGGKYIEVSGRVNTLVLDKTGTLTMPSPSMVELTILDKRYREESLLQMAASAQRSWPHPIGKCILAQASERHLPFLPYENGKLIIGKGVVGHIGGGEILVGSRMFLKERGISFTQSQKRILGSGYGSSSQLFLAKNGKVLAVFSTGQQIREKSKKSISQLRKIGIENIILLTGDTKENSVQVAEELGFDVVRWEQSPEDKAQWITEYRKKYPSSIIGMVGDGINDTPAFAVSDLSLSVADAGTQVTVEYSDVVLQTGSVDKALTLIELGKETDHTIRRSYSLALGLNGVTLALTTFAFISPLAGALLHNLITIIAVGNAATIMRQSDEE